MSCEGMTWLTARTVLEELSVTGDASKNLVLVSSIHTEVTCAAIDSHCSLISASWLRNYHSWTAARTNQMLWVFVSVQSITPDPVFHSHAVHCVSGGMLRNNLEWGSGVGCAVREGSNSWLLVSDQIFQITHIWLSLNRDNNLIVCSVNQ